MYHVFHKLFELRRLLQGQDLHVALRGEEHKFVYRIRTEPLEGDLSRSALLRKAETMLTQLKASAKEFTGPELSHEMIEEWCLSVRTRLLVAERNRT
mmetsp:Transcript_344/g.839  ORF Transcript_344/g.839 Transcript_344/m.839 type:complete len:97 (+) Transcript_344:1186-1476(+)